MESSLAPRRFLRTPSIAPDGASIAFVYASDIWLVPSGGGRADRLTTHPSTNLRPSFAPDGASIVFTSSRTGAGDLYRLPLNGDEIQRLTFRESLSIAEGWSHDGQRLFFSSGREQQGTAIYRTDLRGGMPEPWLEQGYEDLGNYALAPDGALALVNVVREPWWRRSPASSAVTELWVGGAGHRAADFRRIGADLGGCRWARWAADGRGVHTVLDRDGAENVWMLPLDGAPPRQLTHFGSGRVCYTSVSHAAQTMVFEHDFGIWRLDLASGAAEPVAIRVSGDTRTPPVRSQTTSRDLNELALAPDGKKLAFTIHGTVFADFADKETDREQRAGLAFRVSNTPYRERDVAWMPDSMRLVYTSDRHGDPEVYQFDMASRAETRLTHTAAPALTPRPSPDGSYIAYACGNDEIRLIETSSGTDRPFIRASFFYGIPFAWSPDSRWVVFGAKDARFFSNLYVQRVDETSARQITFLANLEATDPLWAPNGRFIIFTTGQYREEAQIARVDLRPTQPYFREIEFEKLFDRKSADAPPIPPPTPPPTPPLADAGAQQEDRDGPERPPETPEPPIAPSPPVDEPQSKPPANPHVEIAFDGIERRLRFLTPMQLDASGMCISPDSRDLLFGATVAGKQNLWSLALDELRADQPLRQITGGGGYKRGAQFAPDGKSFYFLDNGIATVRKYPSGDQTVLPFSAELVIDFHEEKRQIFAEVWRHMRDYFYDPTFRGLDWQAVYVRFAPYIDQARTSGDLYALINLMLGELRASHTGISWPWSSGGSDGYMGLLFDEAEQLASGTFVVVAVLPDSPAALSDDGKGIRRGERLLAIDGTPVADSNMDRLLERTAGRRVRLTLGDAAGGSREVAVRPVRADEYGALRYRAWVADNERYVHRISGGRLGYVHIRAMSYGAYQQLLADLDAETYDKQGVVIDVRFNSGGHTATFIIDLLTRRSAVRSGFRSRPLADDSHLAGNRVLSKPTVLLTNEESASNAEIFSETYRQFGIGKVVGRPTAGAVIWTNSYRLIDGSAVRVPHLRVTSLDGSDLEGAGRPVDVDVARRLGELAGEQDSQLDAAVEVLLAQIDDIAMLSTDRHS